MCGLALLADCSPEYSLAPTLCDDFCRATLRAPCAEEPEDCVRECEVAQRGPDCRTEQRTLTRCYERADSAAFVCVGEGFDEELRVQGGVCLAERDALLGCKVPEVNACLALCRPLQASLDSPSPSAPAALPSDGSGLGLNLLDAGAMDAGLGECVLLRESCETLCWNLAVYARLDVDDPVASGASATDAGSATDTAFTEEAGTATLTATLEAALATCGLAGSLP
jgi:hypothetical protein